IGPGEYCFVFASFTRKPRSDIVTAKRNAAVLLISISRSMSTRLKDSYLRNKVSRDIALSTVLNRCFELSEFMLSSTYNFKPSYQILQKIASNYIYGRDTEVKVPRPVVKVFS